MTSPLSAPRVGRLAIAAVGATVALIPLAGAASAGTVAYGAGPAVNCTASYADGVVTVAATGFNSASPVSYTFGAGGADGAGQGTSFSTPVAGVPAGTLFTSTVSEDIIVTNKDGSSVESKQSCTASVLIGSGTPGTGTGTVSQLGGGGGSTATTPVSFIAPVAVAGTTTTKAATTPVKKVSVLGESVTRGADKTATAAADVAAAAPAAAAPSTSLAFTGSDDIVSGTILGLSLVGGGIGFIVAASKRSRRRQRRSFA